MENDDLVGQGGHYVEEVVGAQGRIFCHIEMLSVCS